MCYSYVYLIKWKLKNFKYDEGINFWIDHLIFAFTECLHCKSAVI